MYIQLKLLMLCLAMDASVGVAVYDSVQPYISQSEVGWVL